MNNAIRNHNNQEGIAALYKDIVKEGRRAIIVASDVFNNYVIGTYLRDHFAPTEDDMLTEHLSYEHGNVGKWMYQVYKNYRFYLLSGPK